jgi:DNA replication protein DnaC
MESNVKIPSWLNTPPLSKIELPTITRKQDLPFDELSWEDFEKLCLRLARQEAYIEYCQLYGDRGQAQQGIDLFGKSRLLDNKYIVYQCKRENNFNATKIKAAIEKFLKGKWVDKTAIFVLCTKESLTATDRADELVAQSSVLHDKEITLLPWDSQQLSEKLKKQPALVDDFFGRAWVKAFCGEDEANKLGHKLDLLDMINYRNDYLSFYRTVFNIHDPGFFSSLVLNSLTLEERYIIPDIYDRRLNTLSDKVSENNMPKINKQDLSRKPFDNRYFEDDSPHKIEMETLYKYEQRQPIDKWLSSSEQNIVLGGPGSGKSTLLRFLVLDLLKESPYLSSLSKLWGTYLPVWVPFASWTRSNCPLSEFLYKWLADWDELKLWPLLERALEDERLLLIVDGLDEWTNELSAKNTLDKLRVFTERRHTPIIMSSRPHGFMRLDLQGSQWHVGELSEFTTAQQYNLANICIKQNINGIDGNIDSSLKAETDSFMKELEESQDLHELAEVPLLLCLLLVNRFTNARLPQSKFKAYASLIDNMIITHPQWRKRAANIPESISIVGNEDMKQILSYLAYLIQDKYSEGIIDIEDTKGYLEEYLKDPDIGFGFDQQKARQLSRDIMSIAENDLGILVKKSPKDMGFIHKVFQEYLASFYIAHLPLSKQCDIVESYCTDPQCKEVLVDLFYNTTRLEDTKKFIGIIKSKIDNVSIIEKCSIELLLSEIAFNDLNISYSISSELAKDTLHQIESGILMPHRASLLTQALHGLRSTKISDLVKHKLMVWFPCRARWRTGIFTAISSWPPTPDTIQCLFRGIQDEEPSNQRVAAKSLAVVARGDKCVGQVLICFAKNALDPIARAVSLEALLSGWAGQEEIKELAIEGSNSISNELRLISIIGKISFSIHNQEDMKSLLDISSDMTSINYYWKNDIPYAINLGWPKSEIIKYLCLDSLKHKSHHDNQLDHEIALQILLDGYYDDNDIAQYLKNEIQNNEYPFIMLHFDGWNTLLKHYKDHPYLSPIIDEWLLKNNSDGNIGEISKAACLTGTEKAKKKMLSILGSTSFPHWPAWSLIERWGMNDIEVKECLTDLAFSPADKVSQIAYLLPKIISDKKLCKKRLLEILKDSKCKRFDFVMDGLISINDIRDDNEAVDIIFAEVLDHMPEDSHDYSSVVGGLIELYPENDKVRMLAQKELLRREGCLSSIAIAYSNDENMRDNIIKIACPLPTTLRKIIATQLKDITGYDLFTLNQLKLYDYDPDPEVKTEASIKYYTLLKSSLHNDVNSVLNSLYKDYECTGSDYKERREAAFCGLVTLGKLEKPKMPFYNSFLDPNIALIRHIVENWNDIKNQIGQEFWNDIFHDLSYFWNNVCLFADEDDYVKDDTLKFLESQTQKIALPNMLRFLSNVRPKSQLLLEYCLQTMSQSDPFAGDAIFYASELLGKSFKGDKDIFQLITSNKYYYRNDHNVVALCEGWSGCNELETLYQNVCNRSINLTIVAYYYLASIKATSDVFLKDILKWLEESINNRYYGYALRNTIRPLMTRIRQDDYLFEMLNDLLCQNQNPTIMATIPKLLRSSRGISYDLRRICADKIDRQIENVEPPEIGFDIFIGKIRPIVYSLYEAINA